MVENTGVFISAVATENVCQQNKLLRLIVTFSEL